MKAFSCGDVVPGCQARFVCSSEDEVLVEVARHAADVHGMSDVGDDVVSAVRAAIVNVA